MRVSKPSARSVVDRAHKRERERKAKPMERKLPTRCPACGGTLVVESLRCPSCRTGVAGEYPMSRFMALSPEQMGFCELFLRCRGNLKDVGAALDISYPTARNRLDDLLRALGFEAESRRGDRLEILEQLNRGEITPAEALKRLGGKEGEPT